jgi:hypothetical protein
MYEIWHHSLRRQQCFKHLATKGWRDYSYVDLRDTNRWRETVLELGYVVVQVDKWLHVMMGWSRSLQRNIRHVGLFKIIMINLFSVQCSTIHRHVSSSNSNRRWVTPALDKTPDSRNKIKWLHILCFLLLLLVLLLRVIIIIINYMVWFLLICCSS